MIKARKELPWEPYLKYDEADGRPYFFLEGAAIYLGWAPKTLSNKVYEGLGPEAEYKNGRNRFYFEQLEIFNKGRKEIRHKTNWHLMRKSA